MVIKLLNEIQSSFYSKATGIKKIKDFYIYKKENEYGVALENIYNAKIDESFSNVKIKNEIIMVNNKQLEILSLMSSLESHKKEFSFFCMQFIENDVRKLILQRPLEWWDKWKELIGNKLHNPKPYDLIAELYTILRLLEENKEKVEWKGPVGSSIDITTSLSTYEVKASLVKYENEITISSQYQLGDYQVSNNVVFYKMEEMDVGISINDVLSKIANNKNSSDKMINDINEKLNLKGYRPNMSVMNKKYIIHEIRKYPIDNNFPKISIETFKDNKIPNNIKKISYVINLDNLQYESWSKEKNENS